MDPLPPPTHGPPPFSSHSWTPSLLLPLIDPPPFFHSQSPSHCWTPSLPSIMDPPPSSHSRTPLPPPTHGPLLNPRPSPSPIHGPLPPLDPQLHQRRQIRSRGKPRGVGFVRYEVARGSVMIYGDNRVSPGSERSPHKSGMNDINHERG